VNVDGLDLSTPRTYGKRRKGRREEEKDMWEGGTYLKVPLIKGWGRGGMTENREWREKRGDTE